MKIKINLYIIFSALFLGITFFSFNKLNYLDTYKVIKVTGEILYKKSNKSMSQGDQFSENEELIFKTSESKAAVISVQKGRFILAPGLDKSKTTAKSNLLPASSNVSSRDGSILNLLDLQNYFSGNILFINKYKVFVGKDNFPQTAKSFFFLRFNFNGETVNKKLSCDGEQIVFDRKEILMVDGKPIDVQQIECKMFYMNDKNTSTLINDFKLLLPENENLKSELGILLEEVSKKTYEEKVDEVMAYLNDFYGKPKKANVTEWLSSEFNITK
ncbi:MAG: hypothetical protein ACK5AY_10555 [Bacteroidota bacterium]|jgi:hypothetical protein